MRAETDSNLQFKMQILVLPGTFAGAFSSISSALDTAYNAPASTSSQTPSSSIHNRGPDAPVMLEICHDRTARKVGKSYDIVRSQEGAACSVAKRTALGNESQRG